jgi:hypothetical protein
MNIMSWRYDELVRTLAGYAKTGVQLVGYSDGQDKLCNELIKYDSGKIFPSGISDDVGLYYFVPKLVRLCHCSLDQAISLFFNGLIVVACIVGIVGFWFYSKSWISRVIATSGLLLFSWYAHNQITDNYLLLPALAIAVVPWGLYLLERGKADWRSAFFFLCSGVVFGYAHSIRAYSSAPLFLFLVCVIVFMSITWWRRLGLCVVLICGVMVPQVHMKILKQDRMQYVDPLYRQFKEEHVFWHNVYAGFGYLRNDLGIEWNDRVVYEQVKVIDPAVVYPSAYYDAVVRRMVFDLVKNHRDFVIQTLFAKLGVLFYYLLMFANFGLLLAFFYRKPWWVELLLWVTVLFSSIFGLIALPGRYYHYILGFNALAFLYCLISIEYALRQGLLDDCMRLFLRIWHSGKRKK